MIFLLVVTTTAAAPMGLVAQDARSQHNRVLAAQHDGSLISQQANPWACDSATYQGCCTIADYDASQDSEIKIQTCSTCSGALFANVPLASIASWKPPNKYYAKFSGQGTTNLCTSCMLNGGKIMSEHQASIAGATCFNRTTLPGKANEAEAVAQTALLGCGDWRDSLAPGTTPWTSVDTHPGMPWAGPTCETCPYAFFPSLPIRMLHPEAPQAMSISMCTACDLSGYLISASNASAYARYGADCFDGKRL